MNILWTTTASQLELPDIADKIHRSLQLMPNFCLGLIGPLGAGKTTLTGALLRSLGLPAHEPVTSPTYTYMNEYQIAGAWYAHLDLYRTRGRFSPEDLGLADARDFVGMIVEWPEVAQDDPYLQLTHALEIAFTPDGSARIYTLKAKASPSAKA